jgi:4-amino-4-deoxychorismate lyase
VNSGVRIWLDGETASDPGLLDRGLHFGDGLFETLVLRQGRIRFRAQHAARLADGCRRLAIACDAEAALSQAETLAGGGDALLKLVVTRGLAVARGYAAVGTERCRQVLLRYPLPTAVDEERVPPTTVMLLRATLGENPLLAGMKHLNRLEQVLARAEMRDSPAFEGILCSSSGLLASGTMTNLFLVDGGRLLTPRVDRCGIAGVMRAIVLREATRLGIAAQEADLPPAALHSAAEAFLTNARLGVRAVTQLAGRALAAGPITLQLQRQVASLEA